MPRIVSIEFLNCIFHNWNRKPDGGCNRQVAPTTIRTRHFQSWRIRVSCAFSARNVVCQVCQLTGGYRASRISHSVEKLSTKESRDNGRMERQHLSDV